MTDISWDAIASPGGFLDWLNAQIAGAPYRLPSEAEWEYAARAGTTTAYSFGADPAALDAYAWFAANSEGTPQPVGMTRPNPWGLYDMHGNAFEWVQDCWHGDYHGAPSDGSAWMAGDRFTRYRDVVRGGDFDASPRFLRSAFRFAFPREKRQSFVGFRLAREVS